MSELLKIIDALPKVLETLKKLEQKSNDEPMLYTSLICQNNGDFEDDDELIKYYEESCNIAVIAKNKTVGYCLWEILDMIVNPNYDFKRNLTAYYSNVKTFNIKNLIRELKTMVCGICPIKDGCIEFDIEGPENLTIKRNISSIDLWTLERIEEHIKLYGIKTNL